MFRNLILVNSNQDLLKYDNRKAIELTQKLGRPLTTEEYKALRIKKVKTPRNLIFKNNAYLLN